jgi:hypothetical protein
LYFYIELPRATCSRSGSAGVGFYKIGSLRIRFSVRWTFRSGLATRAFFFSIGPFSIAGVRTR